MNSTTSVIDRHDHPPQPLVRPTAQRVRRVNPLDRIALTVGIALIRWGRRPRVIESRERRASRIEHQLVRIERERAFERAQRLTLPLR